jgi:hypothetical protein
VTAALVERVGWVVAGLLWLYVIAEVVWRRWAWRRLMLAAHARHPIVNLSPPTNAEWNTDAAHLG